MDFVLVLKTGQDHLALTRGLTRKQVASDLGIGMSTLNKWVSQHKNDDLLSGPHDDQQKELARLRQGKPYFA